MLLPTVCSIQVQLFFQLCLWIIIGRWKKRRSVRIQLAAGEVPSGDTHVMFHADQLHLLVTHETQLGIYDASKMECVSQVLKTCSQILKYTTS